MIVMVGTIVLLMLVGTCFCITNYNAKWNPPKEQEQFVVEEVDRSSDKVKDVEAEAQQEIEMSHHSYKSASAQQEASADGPGQKSEQSRGSSQHREEEKSY